DWVVYRLTGAQATPPSLAARTMAYDLSRRTWSTELLDAAGMPVSLMPPIVPSGQVVGSVTAAAAAQTGLAQSTAVVTGGHDHLVGAFGVGVTEPGHLLNSMGTAEALVLPLLVPALNDLTFQSRANIGAHIARDRYYANVGLHAHGATLDWVRGLLVPDLPLADGFAQVNALAASAPPGSRGTVFQPHLRGITRPIYDPLSRGAFIGLSFQTGRAEMARAVFEGMAFAWRLALESLEQATGLRVEDVTVIGGGTRNPLWLRVKADITQRTLHVLQVEEAVAWGAAALAGVGVGVFRDAADVRARVRFAETVVVPDPALATLYDDVYTHHYRPVYEALKSAHHTVAQSSLSHTA
ncbi:MAG: carbohydrate kinase, partial [Anaerolineae bacterium]|nr:carbohydrate kinase [Anaerolineae bacterium]